MTELQTTWNWMIALDLFLGGLGAGAAVTAVLLALATGERFKRTVRFGTWAAVLSIGLGVLLLVLDTAKPLRALWMPKSFAHLSSWMAIGAWILLAAILVNGLSALFWTDTTLGWLGRLWKGFVDKRKVWRIALALLALPISVGVALYTGILISVLPFRPLWHTWLLPALFTASAMFTGLALVTGYVLLREKAEGAPKLRTVLGIVALLLLTAEAVALYFFLKAGLAGSEAAVRSAELLTTGVLAPYFWALVVAVGLGVPLLAFLLHVVALRSKAMSIPVIGVVCCLAGGLALRFLVLLAGLPVSLSSPIWLQIQEGVRWLP